MVDLGTPIAARQMLGPRGTLVCDGDPQPVAGADQDALATPERRFTI
jgi:hypothetical protein